MLQSVKKMWRTWSPLFVFALVMSYHHQVLVQAQFTSKATDKDTPVKDAVSEEIMKAFGQLQDAGKFPKSDDPLKQQVTPLLKVMLNAASQLPDRANLKPVDKTTKLVDDFLNKVNIDERVVNDLALSASILLIITGSMFTAAFGVGARASDAAQRAKAGYKVNELDPRVQLHKLIFGNATKLAVKDLVQKPLEQLQTLGKFMQSIAQ